MSFSKVTFCLCTLANATTLVSAATIKTTTIRLTIDFIILLAAVRLRSLLRGKHHSQCAYDKENLNTPLRTQANSQRFLLYLLYTNLYSSLQFFRACFDRLRPTPIRNHKHPKEILNEKVALRFWPDRRVSVCSGCASCCAKLRRNLDA